jgi:hypothetical protein
MAIRVRVSIRGAVVRVLSVGLIAGGAFVCVEVGQSLAAPGEWIAIPPQKFGVPVTNTRLLHHPRPASAPTAPDGHAVELTGFIESCRPPKQPRPLSAAPKRLDVLISALPAEDL